MRLAVALGGTDWGRSGIGTYTRAVVSRLGRTLHEAGDELVFVCTAEVEDTVRAVILGADSVEKTRGARLVP